MRFTFNHLIIFTITLPFGAAILAQAPRGGGKGKIIFLQCFSPFCFPLALAKIAAMEPFEKALDAYLHDAGADHAARDILASVGFTSFTMVKPGSAVPGECPGTAGGFYYLFSRCVVFEILRVRPYVCREWCLLSRAVPTHNQTVFAWGSP